MEFRAAVVELDALVERLEREGDARALRLLELIDAVHRPALELIAAGELEHPLARALLAMYDLVPPDARALVAEALDPLRDVELIDVEEGVVRVHASSTAGRPVVEAALRERYPDFRQLVVEPRVEGVPLPVVGSVRAPVFVAVADADDLAPGDVRAVKAGELAVLLVNVDGEVHGFRNGCALDGLPLEGGRLAGTVLVCPWHNCAYDARSGKRVDEPGGAPLAVVPVARRDGALRVAVATA